MRKNTTVHLVDANCLRRTVGRYLILVFGIFLVVAFTSCNTEPVTPPVEPATPTLISVQGHGTFSSQNNVFEFANPVPDPVLPNTRTHHTQATVKISVPYPTSIELAIDGKPLTKVERQLSGNYEYSASIDNPGGNPANWTIGIKTPFDVPLFRMQSTDVGYTLTIVNVSGSKRSAPLTIYFRQPLFYIPPPITGTTTHKTDTPNTAPGTTGHCPGGASEQPIRICFRNPPQLPNDITITACSYADAVKLVGNAYGTSHTQGACGP